MNNVLFVCLGNICRSPVAEAIFKKKTADTGLSAKFMADSAGTSAYHLGESPDARSTENARINGVKVLHKARQFVVEDFNRFDIILAMDYHNLHRIEALAKKHGIVHQGIRLLRSFQNDPETLEVPDPYFGGPEGFQEVFDILDDCNQKLIEYLTAN